MIMNIRINGFIDAEVDVDTIVKELNELELMQRWQYIAKILNNIHLRDIDNLEPGQRDLILNFLDNQKKIYKK